MDVWEAILSGLLPIVGMVMGGIAFVVIAWVLIPIYRRFIARPGLGLLLTRHFAPRHLQDLTVTERSFPLRVRTDLQMGLERLLESLQVDHAIAIESNFHSDFSLAECLNSTIFSINQVRMTAFQFEEVDIGDPEPMRVVKSGLWLVRLNGLPIVMIFNSQASTRCGVQVRIQVGTLSSSEGKQAVATLFAALEEAIQQGVSYRGKVVSLEVQEDLHSGKSVGLKVHAWTRVERDQVILPESTLALLDRNAIEFARMREQLHARRQAVKKGLLLFGQPGTGKTHTIRYLIGALPGYTTVLVSAETIDVLAESMSLARLLQPSIVVIEDVDLFAKQRAQSQYSEQVVLQRLLNEMDGLTADAEILFILTTNRPEVLEEALAARPGRIDQAIEFPLPDEVGRRKLTKLYAQGASIADDVLADLVRRTEGVSGAFVKELMRRSLQFSLERQDGDAILQTDCIQAIDDMLAGGAALNRTLLGATGGNRLVGLGNENE